MSTTVECKLTLAEIDSLISVLKDQAGRRRFSRKMMRENLINLDNPDLFLTETQKRERRASYETSIERNSAELNRINGRIRYLRRRQQS